MSLSGRFASEIKDRLNKIKSSVKAENEEVQEAMCLIKPVTSHLPAD